MAMTMHAKSVKKATMIAVGLLVFAAVCYSLLGVQKRPVLRVAVYRKCDFISIDGSTKVVCTDDTQWMAIELAHTEATPVPTPSAVRGGALGVVPVEAAPVTAEPVAAAPIVTGTAMTVRYSHYWPPLGGPNCSNFVDGVCVSAMASGEPWASFVGTAVACPVEWVFGTTVELDGHVWTCQDRGGAIRYVDGVPWVDFLEETGKYEHGSIVAVHVVNP